jgi:hypothetical protein
MVSSPRKGRRAIQERGDVGTLGYIGHSRSVCQQRGVSARNAQRDFDDFLACSRPDLRAAIAGEIGLAVEHLLDGLAHECGRRSPLIARVYPQARPQPAQVDSHAVACPTATWTCFGRRCLARV